MLRYLSVWGRTRPKFSMVWILKMRGKQGNWCGTAKNKSAFFFGETDKISIDSYVAALRILAETCNYGSFVDGLIRDRIVVGTKDNGTRKRLLRESKLTLNKCIDICLSSEATSVQPQAMGKQEDLKFVADRKQTGKFSEEKTHQRLVNLDL